MNLRNKTLLAVLTFSAIAGIHSASYAQSRETLATRHAQSVAKLVKKLGDQACANTSDITVVKEHGIGGVANVTISSGVRVTDQIVRGKNPPITYVETKGKDDKSANVLVITKAISGVARTCNKAQPSGPFIPQFQPIVKSSDESSVF